MLQILQVKKSAEFQKIGKKCEKFYSHTVLLLVAKTPQIHLYNPEKNNNAKEFCRVGFTVAKTVSKLAHERNLAKRRLREAFRALAPITAKNNFDYVIIARKEILNADFKKIFGDLKFCLTKIHKNNPEKNDRATSAEK